MKLIEIYTTVDRLQGEIIKAFLGSQGIHAEINQESYAKSIGLTAGRLGEVHIFVSEEQVSEALACLKAMEAGEFEELGNINNSNPQEK